MLVESIDTYSIDTRLAQMQKYKSDAILASLILDDGSIFKGHAFGAIKAVAGEIVFNTGMLGYPESMTDPSYRGQILVQTFPIVGNYGVSNNLSEDGLLKNFESSRIHIEALVVENLSLEYSHWSADKSLADWMLEHGVPGISCIDTRALTKRLRAKGTMIGRLLYKDIGIKPNKIPARHLVSEVSIETPLVYPKGKKRIGIIDCGVKNSIVFAFLKRDITIIRFPWDFDVSKERLDGIVISNGPGDPRECMRTVEIVKKLLTGSIPLLGICLGSQILGLAAGMDTYKLKYGHRGQNQPCKEIGAKRSYITTQNHGYAIDSKTLTEDWREWFFNLNDGTNEGIIHISKPFFGAQFHPEASPGPDDTEFLFDMFVRALG